RGRTAATDAVAAGAIRPAEIGTLRGRVGILPRMTNPEASALRPAGPLRTIDAVLRGAYADKSWLDRRDAAAGNRRLVAAGLVLGAIYGASVGSFGLCHGGDRPWLQMASAALKLPATFGLTLAVTFPSLYVFAALMRSPLGGVGTLRLLLAAI